MTRCPSREQLRLLLAEQLGDAERGPLEDHVEGCATCQEALQQLLEADGPEAASIRALGEQPGPTAPTTVEERAATPRPPAGELPRPAIPGYEILSELGRGGMGVVYQARQLSLNRIVALKVLRAGSLAGSAELLRFRAEAATLARLQHPNIVQIYEIGEHAGLPYLALEYVPGGSLADHVAARPQPPRDAARLVETLARAAHAAHQAGVVHRDLKPANILLQRDSPQRHKGHKENTEREKESSLVPPLCSLCLCGEFFFPKLGDFGIAKRLDEAGPTHSGQVMGSPNYMAPEQAAGKSKEIGPAADVWALGAILYELLTGRVPFQAETPLETLVQVVHTEPVPPSRLLPKLPRDLETICLKCLQKDPHKRYATAADLADDLGRYHAGEPIRARPVGPLERAWKWARRRPAVAGLLAALVLVVAGSLAGLTGLYLDANRQRRRADEHAAEAEQRRQEAQAARDNAEEKFRLARGVVDDLLTRFGDEKLKNVPQMTAVRQEFLARAQQLYRRFAAEKSDEPELQFEAGRAYQRLAIVQRELGRFDEAESAQREAERLLADLAARVPEKRIVRQHLASVRSDLGQTLLVRGRLAEAEEYFRRAMAEHEQLLAAVPANPEYQQNLSVSHQNLARILARRGRPADAEAAWYRAIALMEEVAASQPDRGYRADLVFCWSELADLLDGQGRGPDAITAARKALELCERLSQEAPADAAFRGNLAGTNALLARLLAHAGRRSEAEDFYRKAIRLFEQLAADFPNVVGHAIAAGGHHCNLATLVREAGRPEEGLAEYARAAAILEAVLARDGRLPDARQFLGTTHSGWAWTLARLGRHGEAVSHWDRAIALSEGRMRLLHQLGRAQALAGSGRVEEAIAAGEALAKGEKERITAYQLAGVYAVASAAVRAADADRAERYAVRALGLIRQDLAAGHPFVRLLPTDPHFEALRGRKDFQELLREVAASSKKTPGQ
jgi:serine/threonine protein kinase/tetratricopeptide (TPR) repeat protein